jgi:hypothetical protein
MKDLKHIKRFNESEDNLNISDVSDSYYSSNPKDHNKTIEIYE